MTLKGFSELINYNRGTLHQIINGNRKAGKKLIKIIMNFTDNQVTEADVLHHYMEKQKDDECKANVKNDVQDEC